MTTSTSIQATPSPCSPSDASLLAASQRGEMEAFGQLIARYQNLVCAVAFSRTGDRSLSEDVGQETFLTAFQGLDGLREPDKLRSWLCGIARNLSSVALRKNRRETSTPTATLETSADKAPTVLESAIAKETEQTVWLALEKLPETYREPLVLFYRENQSVKEVASSLGLSVDATKQRLSRGRQALKGGVSDLVEQTLAASRPNKAFTAAVLGFIVAHKTSVAAAGTEATTYATSEAATQKAAKLVASSGRSLVPTIAIVLATVAVVGGAGFGIRALLTSQNRADQAEKLGLHSNSTKDDRLLAATLKKRRAAAVLADKSTAPCELRGSVTDQAGQLIPLAHVGIDSSDASGTSDSLDVIAVDDQGRWSVTDLAARVYTVSVSAPGFVSVSRDLPCGLGGLDRSTSVRPEVVFEMEAGGAPLQGKVTDIGGGPIANAMVAIIPVFSNSNLAVVRTDSDGAFNVSVAPARYRIGVTHSAYAAEFREVAVNNAADTADDNEQRENFVLIPGATLAGQVVDTNGKPVAGAQVRAALSLSTFGPATLAPTAALMSAFAPVTTDSEGNFEISGLPPGQVTLNATTATAHGSSTDDLFLGIGATKDLVSIEVHSRRIISGFVVAADAPTVGIEGVLVVLHRGISSHTTAVTDPSGYFELAATSDGSFELVAMNRDGGGTKPRNVEVSGSDVSDLLLRIERGAAIQGTVETDNAFGVRFESNGTDLLLHRSAVIHDKRFEFPNVPPGRYTIVATTLTGEARQTLDHGNETSTVGLRVEPLGKLVGRVVNTAGTPQTNVVVVATPKTSDPDNTDPFASSPSQTRTNAKGRFVLPGLSDGSVSLRVFAKGQQLDWNSSKDPFADKLVEIPKGTTVETQLVVETPVGVIRGLVVDRSGAPVDDAFVFVRQKTARRAPRGYRSTPVLSDADGSFRVEGLSGESVIVTALGSTGARRGVITTPLNGAPIEITLQMVSILDATVTEAGKPADDYEVMLRNGAEFAVTPMFETRLGGFTTAPLTGGEWELEVANSTGYFAGTVRLGPTLQTSRTFELQPFSGLSFRVVGRKGAAIEDATVLIPEEYRLSGFFRGASILADGSKDHRFVETKLRAGSGTLMITAMVGGKFTVRQLEVELKPGEVLELGDVELAPPVPLADRPYDDHSEDLGIRFFVGPNPPTAEQLAALDASTAAKDLLETQGAHLWIAFVEPNGIADSAGLVPGDRVKAVGQMIIDDSLPPELAMTSLSGRWRSRGNSVEWKVVRDNVEQSVHVLAPPLKQ